MDTILFTGHIQPAHKIFGSPPKFTATGQSYAGSDAITQYRRDLERRRPSSKNNRAIGQQRNELGRRIKLPLQPVFLRA